MLIELSFESLVTCHFSATLASELLRILSKIEALEVLSCLLCFQDMKKEKRERRRRQLPCKKQTEALLFSFFFQQEHECIVSFNAIVHGSNEWIVFFSYFQKFHESCIKYISRISTWLCIRIQMRDIYNRARAVSPSIRLFQCSYFLLLIHFIGG